MAVGKVLLSVTVLLVLHAAHSSHPPHHNAHQGLFHDDSKHDHHHRRQQQLEDIEFGSQPSTHQKQKLHILHFNDVYEIKGNNEKREGGAPRFLTLIDSKIAELEAAGHHPLILFSGDVLNPSLLSQATRGKHMVPVLQAMHVDCAVLGNHEFDFGLEHATSMVKQFGFPWLGANLIDRQTGKPLAGAQEYAIFNRDGLTIGIFGVVELEWLRVSCIDESIVEGLDPVEVAQRLAQELRSLGADIVIAMTHMREHNDWNLASAVPDIDIVLGGHDHYYKVDTTDRSPRPPMHIVKSGSDFHDLSHVVMSFVDSQLVDTEVTRLGTANIPENDGMLKFVEEQYSELHSKLQKVIGHTNVNLDATEILVRSSETAIGNFIADIMRSTLNTDIAILNSGTIRYDGIIPAGPITLETLMRTLPMLEELVVLELTGEQVLMALTNGVSEFANNEGRFPQVSGIRFEFDSDAVPPRVLPNSVFINDEPLQHGQHYLVATKQYLARGKDGYRVFTQGRVVVDSEECPVLPTAVRNFFTIRRVALDFLQTAEMKAHDTLRKGIARRQNEVYLGKHAIEPVVEGRIVNVANDPRRLVDMAKY